MKRAVLTIGTFDLYHEGHVNLLARCRMLAGRDGTVVVALNPDEFIERYKGHAPVIPYAGRLAVLQTCRYVDRVVCNYGGSDAKPIIEVIGPDIIAVGDDWASKDYLAQLMVTSEWLATRRIKIEYLPYTQGISSSLIRTALR
jgi:cytidyltransferase-like protein